jgi:hypothetical protein
MSLGVEYEEPDFMKKKYNNPNNSGGMPAYLIKSGWAHDATSANKLLIFVAILFILAAAIVYYMFVVRPQQTNTVSIPNNVVDRLSPETQAKIKAQQ